MSILRVANVHFESTGANRIDYVGDTVNIVAGGSVVLSANQSQGIIVGRTNVIPAFDQANAAFTQANTVFTKANGAYVNVQTFDASGTWNKPAGFAASSRVYVQMWSGGGSGARGRAISSAAAVGGSGGGYAEFWYNLSTLGTTESITVGAGGASITTGNNSGANGSSSIFGSYVTVTGGEGGRYTPAIDTYARSGGLILGSTPIAATGSTAEGRSGGFTSRSCADAANEPNFGYNRGGGGGFAAPGMADTSLTVANGAYSVYGGGGGGALANIAVSGFGGPSLFGGRGGNAATNFITAGEAGQTPAGGGGTSSGNNVNAVSGAGGNGRIIVTVFPA